MRITVKGFNETNRYTASLPAEGTLTVPEACTVGDVLDGLGIPQNVRTKLVLFCNGRPTTPTSILNEGDHLVLLAPMSGG